MTYVVEQNRDGNWWWEVMDDDGQTYLRSEGCFEAHDQAVDDLFSATHLIRSYLQ